MGFQFAGAPAFRTAAPMQAMRPMAVQPMGVGPARMPVMAPSVSMPTRMPTMAPQSQIFGPSRVAPQQVLQQPNFSGAIPQRLSPGSISATTAPARVTSTAPTISGTTNNMNWNRPGVLLPGQTGTPTGTITGTTAPRPQPTTPITTTTPPTTTLPTGPGIGARPVGPATPVYQQPQPSWWDRIVGNTPITVGAAPGGGIQVGVGGAPVGGPYVNGGRYYPPNGGRMQPGIGYSPTQQVPYGVCTSAHGGYVGWFDQHIGNSIRAMLHLRQQCVLNGAMMQSMAAPGAAMYAQPGAALSVQVGSDPRAIPQQQAAPQGYAPAAQGQFTPVQQSGQQVQQYAAPQTVDPRFLTTPAMPAPGSVQQGVPIQQQNPSVFQQ